jgi:hypothetical protein
MQRQTPLPFLNFRYSNVKPGYVKADNFCNGLQTIATPRKASLTGPATPGAL